MGKGNTAKNFNKSPEQKAFNRMKNNYFTDKVSRDGEDFLNRIRPDQLQRDCNRIFREMVMGRIDYRSQSVYLANPILLNTMIAVSYNNYQQNVLYVNALSYYITQNNSNGITVEKEYVDLYNKHKIAADIYSVINTHLNNFFYTFDTNIFIQLGGALNYYSNYKDFI